MSTSPAGNPLFGRRWRLTVADSGGNNLLDVGYDSYKDPESLRVTFDIWKPGYSAWWYGDITVYNLNGPTEQAVLTQGMIVTLSAGYQSGNYGIIFQGPLFQPKWERINVTDYAINLHCIVPLFDLKDNFVNLSQAAGLSQRDLIAKMAASAHSPIAQEYLSPQVSSKSSPRGVTLFGSPSDIFDAIADDNNMQWWVSEVGYNLGSANESSPPPTLVYCPAGIGEGTQPADALPSLIGTPQQTQFGCNFRVLLDPRVKMQAPPMQVKLDMAQIRQMTRQLGQYAGILDNDGIYKVIGLRQIGDTRGNEWYTEITGATGVGGKLAMMTGLATQDLSAGAGN